MKYPSVVFVCLGKADNYFKINNKKLVQTYYILALLMLFIFC